MLVLRDSSSWNSTTLWRQRELQLQTPAEHRHIPGYPGNRAADLILGGERESLRVVLMDVDVVERGLLQAEDVDHRPVEDVVGLGKELVEAPALLLVGLQDVGKNRCQEALKAPATANADPCPTMQCGQQRTTFWEARRTWTGCRKPASRCSTRSSHFHTSGAPRWFLEVSP